MTIKTLLKTGVSVPIALSGGANLVGRATGKRWLPLVLGYHRVVKDYSFSSRFAIPASLISTRMLTRQLEWIAKRYEICALDDVDEKAKSRSGKPVAAITFDDGYADVYHNAFPLLTRMGIPFTVFASPDLLVGDKLFAHDELYLRLSALLDQHERPRKPLDEILHRAGCWNSISGVLPSISSEPYRLTRAMLGRFRHEEVRTIIDMLRGHTDLPSTVAEQSYAMNWNMLLEMRRAGVLVGCHSKSHAILTNEDSKTVQVELGEGRKALESRLGVPITHFAYPDGAFNDVVIRAVAQAGYSHAYTVCFHRSEQAPKLTIPRRMLWERTNVDALERFSGSILSCLVNGVFDANAACATGHR